MKILRNAILIAWLLPIGFAIGCGEDDDKTIDFVATFFTTRGNELEPCGEAISPTNFWALEHQVGNGTATTLGEFTAEMTFCIHLILTDEGLPDPTQEGFGEYGDGEGELLGENGDKIFFELSSGKVKPTTAEGYIFEFQDTIVVTGGTGAFEGGRGDLITDSYVSPEGTTDHVWSGELTIPN